MKSDDKMFISVTLGAALFSLCLIVVIIFNFNILGNASELIIVNIVVILMGIFMATQRYKHLKNDK